MSLFTKVFGTYSDRQVKKIEATADKIEALGGKYAAMSDAELRAQTDVLRGRLAKGETTDDILPDAFAVVAEASERVLGIAPVPRAAHRRRCPASGPHRGDEDRRGQDARRHPARVPERADRRGRAHRHGQRLSGALRQRVDGQSLPLPRPVGRADRPRPGFRRRAREPTPRTSPTAPTTRLGFDYLRDNMVIYKERMVQRGHAFAIVDEVDSILIDEARTPLIISGRRRRESTDALRRRRTASSRTLKCFRIKEIDAQEGRRGDGRRRGLHRRREGAKRPC